jgi:multidrug efflux pump subunit AcrB
MRRPRYLALAALSAVAVGAASLTSIGRQEDPTITNIFATVTAALPGAAPDRVEALVTEKIEAELREIAAIKVIESTSKAGLASISIELSETLPDAEIPSVWSDIREALDDADLPPEAGAPVFDDDRVGAFTAIAAIRAEPGRDPGIGVLTRLAEQLQDRLRGVPSTRLVDLYGAGAEEVRVAVDGERLAAAGLTPGDLAAALAGADARRAAGRVRGAADDFLVEVAGGFDSLSRIRETPLRAGADGRVLRVQDVASVTRTERAPPAELALSGGARAVLVAARAQDDRQVDRWAAAVRAEIAAFAAAAPAGVAVTQVFDQSAYVADQLTAVGLNLALGVALVTAVLFVTMGWRAALIVAAALPLTSLISLAILERLGIVIHQMSITGMIVALGLLVDAAIVMTDEVRQALAAGASRLSAARGATRRLAAPLAASTLTTVLAFVPMAALPGPAGDFVGAIALAVIVMLVVSFGLALTVTAASAGLFLALPDGPPRWWRDGLRGGWLARAFDGSLGAALRWRVLAMTVAAAPALVGFLAMPTLTKQFFPDVERDQLHVQLDLGQGASLSRTHQAALAAEAVLRADPAVRDVHWTLGRSAPAFYYNMLANREAEPGFAEALVFTTSAEATDAAIPRLQAALDGALPQALALVRGLKQGPPVDAPLEMRLVGPSVAELRRLGEEARRVMAAVPAVGHTRAELTASAPKLVFALDEDRARRAGFTLSDAAAQLQALGEGVTGGALLEGTEALPVRVRLPDADRGDAEALAGALLVPPDAPARLAQGRFPAVPLSALGDFRLEPADGAIVRRNGERVNTVQGFVAHGTLPDEALADLQARLQAAPLALPAGYRIEWGGESDARGETVRNLLSTVGLVVAATVATVVLTFNSWRLAAVTLVVAGLSMGLSLLSLAAFGFPFGINALIGVIGSIGVSVNAAIIILTALQADPAAAAGDRDAMRAVVMRASRHIVSTTVTTFGGFLPLILEGGGFWPPFAMAIAGGVLLSTVLSYYSPPPASPLGAPRAPRAAATPPALRLAAE